MHKRIEFGEVRVSDVAKQHVMDCLENNYITSGPKVQLFEKKWAEIFNYPYSVALNSGTSAVTACCMALYEYGAKPGDYVLCPALSFIATANAIRAAGFTPAFVDIRRDTLNIDEQKLDRLITSLKEDVVSKKKIAGLVIVNLMGKPSRLDIIQEIADKHKLKVIVDNCEAYGSKVNDKYSLEYADMEATSHYVAHIICAAQLSTVSVKTKELQEIIQSIRSHGREPNSLYFNHIRYGFNFQPTDLHASIGLGEIDDFWKIFNKRKDTLKRYREALNGLEDKVYLLEEDVGCSNAPHGFSITLKEKFADKNNFHKLTKWLDEANIHWKRNFGAMHTHKTFEYLKYRPGCFINAEYVGTYGIHIGCHYWLSDEDIDYVCESLKNIVTRL